MSADKNVFPNHQPHRPLRLEQLRVKPWLRAPPPKVTLINCKLIDAEKGKVSSDLQTIVIEGGHVVSVEATTEAHKSQQDGNVVDVQSKFVCPGLVDAHVHVQAVPGARDMGELGRMPAELVTLRTTHVLGGMLDRGFTTVRDTGGATKFLANSIDEGLIRGPRLFQCGKALSQTGGHGDPDAFGVSGGDGSTCCGGHVGVLSRVADGVPAVLKAVREELKQGADFIKIMAGGGVASATDSIESIQYNDDEVRTIVDAAWKMGRKMVTAHAYTIEGMRHAIDNGVRGIEHGNFVDEETAKLMVEKGVYLTPTLGCYGAMARPPWDNLLPPDGKIKNREVMKLGLHALKVAHDAGVMLCYGSDMLVSLHALQTEEFTVRASVLPAAAILKSATITPAKMLGLTGKIGVIAPGSFADLVVLEENPLDDITTLDRPEDNLIATVKEGRLVSGMLKDFPKK